MSGTKKIGTREGRVGRSNQEGELDVPIGVNLSVQSSYRKGASDERAASTERHFL
jgi:hypothetical protein